MNEIRKLSELDENQVNQSIDVFIEGFYNVFSSISKEKKKLHRLFKNSFDYDISYAYLQDGEAVGFLGIADYQKRPLKLNREIFIETIGGIGGEISYKMMSAVMEKPHAVGPAEIYIDYLATSPEHRSKGIGKQLIEFVRDTLGYKQILLEVFTKNTRAIAFYERFGFKQIKIQSNIITMLQGFGKPITMRMDSDYFI
ncbi:MAG: GNAT family N-acetyltransferase [Oscillospiraceae bacterium]|nr:GNAT family N-acetyltransferase [Oscillospiraceae bacterium]